MIRALLATIGFAVTSASAFSPYYSAGHPERWDFSYASYPANVFNATTKAIRFQICTDTATVANRTAELNAIRASFAQWQAISGTILKFEEGPLAPAGLDINLGDGTNAVFWAKSTLVNGGQDDITARAGYTLVALDAENRILEADIAFNGVKFTWFTDFNNTLTSSKFVESIALHEIGHFLGLDHTPLGGATVVDGQDGIGPSAGLSSDELAAARFLYPAAGTPAQYGAISGFVHMNGTGIHGAIVTAENAQGFAVSANASDENGNYNLPALTPGAYNVHASPLDPDSAATSASMFRPQDIAADFGVATTAFLPAENTATTVTADGNAVVNFNVVAGEPPLRIQQLSRPAPFANAPSPTRFAVGVNPGTTAYFGVASTTITVDTTLSISGDGVTIGATQFQASKFGALNLLQGPVTIAANATPGLRTVVVRRGSNLAYANGYFEVYPTAPDYNFDGLDDRFQRQYFPLFTAPEAAPTADPDGDHFSNAFEALTGTNPTNAQSYSFLIERVDIVRGAARVTWKSDVGKQYQLYGKDDVAGATWQAVGGPITATTNSTSVGDSTSAPRFYKLKLLP